ncbi:MAG: sugar transferase, partial [Cohaesibacter sp.]|nr:sugar transferase [Cohaesibacter sp.]
MKRLFDLVIAVPVFLVSAPIIFLVACLVRLESKGSPIFVQIRVGQNGRLFKIYKIRSMRQGTPNLAT